MKKLIAILCASAVLLYACNNDKTDDKTAGVATDSTGTTKPDPCAGYVKDTSKAQPMDSATMEFMNKWMAYATPGSMHQMLAKDDGAWDGEVTHWMAEGAPAKTSKSTVVNRMIMGGRYQQGEHSGCFDGMAFEGMSLVGYDNAKKAFVSTWIDNMGTGFMNIEGKYDSTTKTIKFAGKCINPISGQEMNVREEFAYVDDNTQKMTMWGPDMVTGKEYKTMEIVFKRRAK